MSAYEPSLTISEGNCFNDICTWFKWNKECLRVRLWLINFDFSNVTMLTTSLKLLPGPQPQHLTVTGWLWWLLWLRTLISSTIIQKLPSLATQWDVFTLFGSSTRNNRYLQYPTIQKRYTTGSIHLYDTSLRKHTLKDWKDSYVDQWIPTSGVFSGAALGVVQVLSGDIRQGQARGYGRIFHCLQLW